ncbi:hypothetical protein [Sphingobacterium suaedae]|uniref:Outer membrane protein beta-barrel domain-containing protein n=1 Tax=Sphingobacterium suaedae TaxID=1686402 RepID=A0ABW5KG66_9SPHI
MKKLLPIILLCLTTGICLGQDFKPYYSNNFNFGVSYTAGRLNDNFTAGFDDDDIDFLGLQFDYIGLFHLTPKIGVGAGTGMRHMVHIGNDWENDDDWDLIKNYLSIPVYAHAKFRFIDKRVSPFLATSIGYNFRVGSNKSTEYWNGSEMETRSSISSGLLANAQAGVNVRIGRRIRISAGPYFEYRQGTLRNAYWSQSHDGNLQEGGYSSGGSTSVDLHMLEVGVKVGLSF